jgi:hypothetical protein
MPGRNVAQQVSAATTTTGLLGPVYFGGVACGNVSVLMKNGSTHMVQFVIRGGMAGTTSKFALAAVTATGASTGTVHKSSTIAGTFDRVWIDRFTNDTTGGDTITWTILAR